MRGSRRTRWDAKSISINHFPKDFFCDSVNSNIKSKKLSCKWRGSSRRELAPKARYEFKLLHNNLPTIERYSGIRDQSFSIQEPYNSSFTNSEKNCKIRYDSIDAIMRTPRNLVLKDNNVLPNSMTFSRSNEKVRDFWKDSSILIKNRQIHNMVWDLGPKGKKSDNIYNAQY